MIDTSVAIRGQQRDIIDYMRDVYGIDDIKIRPGGRHLHVEYVYAGRKHKDTFPRHGSDRGDPNWLAVRKRDLRKYLGDPPEPEVPTKRKLDDMTQEAQAKADLLTSTAIGAVVNTPAIGKIVSTEAAIDAAVGAVIAHGKTVVKQPAVPVQNRFPCTIGTFPTSTDIAFYLGRDLAEAMEQQFGKGRRYVLSYHHRYRWTARPSRDGGRAIEMQNHRLRYGGAEEIKGLGRFATTRGEATMHHNHIEFWIPNPVATVMEAEKPIAAEPQVIVPTPAPALTAVGRPVPPPAPPVPPVDPRERHLHVLRQIREIEDEGVYKLIPADEGWRWRAFDIKLEG